MLSVLVVDDENDIREAVSELLAEEGYVVLGAGDGKEALKQLRDHHPSVVLLDLMMPVMNGFQFRAEQRSDPELARIPVILVSADRTLDREARAMDVAARIAKPTEVEDLLATIAQVAGR